jgi:PII-like signaling protein
MKTEVNAKQVVIYINSSDQWQGRPLYSAIVERCQELGLAGASVVRCAEGFGASHHLHTSRLLSLTENLPVRLEIVDVPERIKPLLKVLDEMIDQGLVTVSDVHTFRFQREAKK